MPILIFPKTLWTIISHHYIDNFPWSLNNFSLNPHKKMHKLKFSSVQFQNYITYVLLKAMFISQIYLSDPTANRTS